MQVSFAVFSKSSQAKGKPCGCFPVLRDYGDAAGWLRAVGFLPFARRRRLLPAAISREKNAGAESFHCLLRADSVS